MTTWRNITVAVPEPTLRHARQWAALHDTSVSALVSRYLQNLGEQNEEERRISHSGKKQGPSPLPLVELWMRELSQKPSINRNLKST